MNRLSKDERISGRIAAVAGACFGIVLLLIAAAALERGGGRELPRSSVAISDPLIKPVEPTLTAVNVMPPRTRVYECETPNGRVLSDTVCGPNAVAREVDAARLSTYRPVPVPEGVVQPAEPAPPPGESPAAVGHEPASLAECRSIQAQVDSIDAAMRQGYPGSMGDSYREHRRKLTTLYYDLRCSITGRR